MILPAENKMFELSVPILVIGAGACGISAALTAKENNAKVMVLERDNTPSGSSALSTCLIPAAGTKLQAAAAVEDSIEIFAEDMIAKARNKSDPDMAYWVAAASGETVDWLVDTVGLPLSLITGFKYPGHSVYRMHGSPNRTGSELMAVMNEAIGR